MIESILLNWLPLLLLWLLTRPQYQNKDIVLIDPHRKSISNNA